MDRVTRYTFQGELELTGALHIGSGGGGAAGRDASLTDATIVRDSGGRPYIPGSSLRGLLRATVAQIAPTIFGDEVARIIEDEGQLKRLREAADKSVQAAREAAGDFFDAEEALQKALEERLSPAERLFGTVHWASPLHISDLHLLEGDAVDGEIRHGVGIDRDTGAARDAIKYDFEVLPRGQRFRMELRCAMPEAHEDRWQQMLAIGLRLLEQGELTLGGRAARGVGQVRLVNLRVYRLRLDDKAALIRALIADDRAADRLGQPVEGWMQRTLAEVQRAYASPE